MKYPSIPIYFIGRSRGRWKKYKFTLSKDIRMQISLAIEAFEFKPSINRNENNDIFINLLDSIVSFFVRLTQNVASLP